MSVCMSVGLGIGQVPRLSLEQRLEVQTSSLNTRLDLAGALNGDGSYRPEAACEKCGRNLTPLEIFKGFNTNPNDFTTCCSGCGHRFEPKLIWSNAHSRIEIRFYCDLQTQAQLKGLENLSPEELRKKEPGIYHSAVAHHGLLKNAFKAAGISYEFDEVADVKKRVEPFLGQLPDTVIAEMSGLKVNTVRRMRKTARIDAYSYHAILKNN